MTSSEKLDLDSRWQTLYGLHRAVLNNNIYACSRETQEVDVNVINFKGETALHLAAKSDKTENAIFSELLNAGADVNVRNYWGQTPLHYAAIAKSVRNLKILLEVSQRNINYEDGNGYTALHCFIHQIQDTEISDNCDDSDCQEGINLLLNAGADINRQTKFGHSIFHIASCRLDNSIVLRHIIWNSGKLDMKLENQMGENFLHIYAQSGELFEDMFELLDGIAEKNLSILCKLLNHQDVFGNTPWSLILDSSCATVENASTLLKWRSSFKITDNFKNTTLHRITCSPYAIEVCELLEVIIKGGAEVNAQNIFGQSAASMVYLPKVLDVFIKSGMDFNAADRWRRSPLVSIMKLRPTPAFLKHLIAVGNVDVNARDVYGSTPLHFAAYNNYEEQVELLLSCGADKNATDDVGDKPIDTATRHNSFRCHQILRTTDETNVEILYIRDKSFKEILLDLPRSITSSRMKFSQEVQSLLGLPKDKDGFIQHLMTAYFLRDPEHSAEVAKVVSTVHKLVESICLQVGKYDSRFEMTLFPTGSSAEGTKVGRPDEFDFVLCLEKLNEICKIRTPEKCLKTGYACLVLKEVQSKEEYLPFSDNHGYFLAFPYLQYLFRYIKRALSETDLWREGNVFYNFEYKMRVISGKPVFNFEVYWCGSIYKQLKISIDLVPAVYKQGWWPDNVNLKDFPLVNETVKNAGCFLILQTFENKFDFETKYAMDDTISHTCNAEEDEEFSLRRRMLRISAAPAEISLMKSLPKEIRHSYALAKILKSEEVCPEIEIDELPTMLFSKLSQFNRQKSKETVHPSHFIKSYMLKNCIFYAMQEIGASLCHLQDWKIPEITTMVYRRLLESTDERYLNPYFLPYSDVFEFEKDEKRSTYKDFMLRLKRELCVKLVLGILTYQFPEICIRN